VSPLLRRLLLLAVCLVPSEALAFRCKVSQDFSYVTLHWESRFGINYGLAQPGSKTLTGDAAMKAIDWAFTQWQAGSQPCTDLTFASHGVVAANDASTNKVVFLQSWPYDMDAVALTRTTYGTEDGLIRGATMDVNEERFTFVDATMDSVCQSNLMTAAGSNFYDLAAVLTHEAGHFIGLDHTQPENVKDPKTDPTMAPVVNPCETYKRNLKQDDIDGLCLLYPKGLPSGTCGQLPQQTTPYVANTPLGCSESGRGRSPWTIAALFALTLLRARRPCPRTRSRR
jgi:hypothetical protein